jgi:hypothetical protein
MAEQFRLLTQPEIRVVRWLAKAAGYGRPVTMTAAMRQHVPALWRMDLIEVWSRCIPHGDPQAPGLYFNLSLEGMRRAQPFLASRRAGRSCDTARSIPSGKKVDHDGKDLR